jgi:8-oxo-dGTP diphosphatase
VTLPGAALSPGLAQGRLRGSRPDPAPGAARGGTILTVPASEWPLTQPVPPEVLGVVVQGFPDRAGPATGVPAVAGFDRDLLREGETVRVDGAAGTLSIEGITEVPVVTAFLERADGRILLLRRSDRVATFRGRWAAVSGYLEDPTPLDQALREIREETGLPADHLELIAEGRPVLARDGSTVFIVHPFRFLTRSSEVRIDREHTAAEWVDPSEIDRRTTVPKLDHAWRAVAVSSLPKP